MMIETVTIEEEIYFVFSEWIAEQGLNFIITISPPSFFLLRMEQKREKTFLRLTFKRKVGVAGFNKILVLLFAILFGCERQQKLDKYDPSCKHSFDADCRYNSIELTWIDDCKYWTTGTKLEHCSQPMFR